MVCKIAYLMPDELLSTKTVADMLKTTVTTINRWAIEGRIKPAGKVPTRTGARLYRRSEVERVIAVRAAEMAARDEQAAS
jgi:DNA-binding transcriptional MerR regulator